LKQIGLGLLQYTQDYDEKFPLYNNALAQGWAIVSQPYLKSEQIFQCPSEPTGATTTFTTDYNYNLWMGWTSSVPPGPISQAVLTQPSLTAVVFDNISNSGNTWDAGGQGSANCSSGCTPALAYFRGGAQRHLDGQNFMFADGHVKWYKGTTDRQSAAVYNVVTPGSGTGVVSGNSPTLNTTP
jgi:prepilin-type processing-associated H-X9-DG protein